MLRGNITMKGYLKNPKATEAAFRDGWFHTGDLARVDEDGYVYVVDRKKDMVISGGENIYPAEIENVIDGFEEVSHCAVIGIPDDKWGEVGLALVRLRPGRRLDAGEVLDRCRGQLARYKVPKHVRFVEELPLSPQGKVLKTELRRRYLRADDAPAR